MSVSNTNTSGKNSGSSGSALLGIIIAGALVIAGGFLIATFWSAVLPKQASAESRQVDDLFRFMLIIGGAIFLLVQGLLAYSVLRFRAKPGDTTDGPAIHGNTTLEFVWTAIPAVVVAVLAVYSYNVWTSIRAPKPNEQVSGVVGARFAWTFNYNLTRDNLPVGIEFDALAPEIQEDLNDGGITINYPQLATYVDQPVKLDMVSNDVIHSFWVPAMRIKQDLLPGRVTEIRFTPIEVGTYRVVCAELCGSGHGNMAGQLDPDGNVLGAWVVVYPDEATFRREFFDPEAMNLLFPPEDPALAGRAVLASGKYPCATCHTLTDLGWTGNLAPSLDGIGTRTSRLDSSGLPDMATYLHESIRHPNDYTVPGYATGLMPAFNPEPDQPNYMPESDLENIIAYLLTQTGE